MGFFYGVKMKRIVIEGEFGWEISSSGIRDLLDEAGGEDLDVHLASPGGSVFEGIKVYNDFRDYKRKYPKSQNILTVKGLAASMASYFAMNPAFEIIAVEDNAVLMIHNPWGGVIGDYRETEKFTEMLKGLTDLLALAYVQKTGREKREIRQLMDNETWFFGTEIKNAGFADEVIETKEDKEKNSAIANAKIQFKETEKKIRGMEIDDNEILEIAAFIDIENSEPYMPYPNEHAARVREPGDFEEKSFRRKNIETGIDIIIGRLKGKTTTTTQAYRFKKDKFTTDEAKKWLKDHDIKYIKFEAASGELNPALSRDNINQEVIMTLKEFLEQNPAARKEYEDELKSKFDAGVKSVQDRIAGAMVYIKPDSEYPAPIRGLAIQVVEGKVTNDSLSAAVATYDSLVEKGKSDDAKDESEKTKNATGQQIKELSDEFQKDGIIKSETDLMAVVNQHKTENGMEVT
jgi:ATP-dependent protease ClpP protease subunit